MKGFARAKGLQQSAVPIAVPALSLMLIEAHPKTVLVSPVQPVEKASLVLLNSGEHFRHQPQHRPAYPLGLQSLFRTLCLRRNMLESFQSLLAVEQNERRLHDFH